MSNYLNNFQQPIYHDASREDLAMHANAMANTERVISSVGQEMIQTSDCIRGARQEITVATDEIRNIVARSRKKKGGCELVKMADEFVMVQSYTYGEPSVKKFFTNIGSDYEGVIYHFPDEIAATELVEIVFDKNVHVIFLRKNANGAKVYQAFLTAGIHFNPEIPVGVIKRELEKFVLTIINGFPVKMIIPVVGWGEKNWFHTGKDYAYLSKWIEFPELPVMDKVFPYIMPEKRHVEDYFELSDQVKDRKLKYWMILYPLCCLMTSMMARYGCNLDYCLNIVTEDQDVRREICKRMSIFNRDNVAIASLEENKNSLNSEFSKYGDEIIFLAADKPEMRDYNIERKLQTNVEHTVNILARKRSLPSPYRRPVYSGAVIFSNYPLALKGLITIYADKDDFGVFHADEYIIYDWIYQEFIKYVSKNYEKITSYFTKMQFNASEQKGMRCLLQIVDEFWKTKKVDIIARFNETDVDCLLGEMCNEVELVDEVELFRVLVRKEIRYIPVYTPKDQIVFTEKFCICTKEYLIIPVKLFNYWLEKANVVHIKKKVLNTLSVNGYLKTHERYIYKFQNAGNRCDTYCIALEFFNRAGEIPVEKLGGRN